MQLDKKLANVEFRNETLKVNIEQYKCTECGFEGGTPDQVSKIQSLIADAYREKVNLLTSSVIRSMRKMLGMSQKQFSVKLNIGIASIKRWETGVIQSKSMDNIIRLYFENTTKYNGNRDLSIPRIKLVILAIQTFLKKELLFSDSKFLFTAKYLWYADMIAFRDLNRSMTGSTYAVLPRGPQLDNYNDLIESIRKSEEGSAEPLTEDEQNILKNIANKFPKKFDVKSASHKEPIWINGIFGDKIPYTEAKHITAL